MAADPRIRFYGNVEGRDIMNHTVDVVVTDGFTGNVALKTLEGTAKAIMKALRQAIDANVATKVGGALLRSELYRLRDALDPEEYGGALLVGMQAPVIIAHGSSQARGVANAVRQGARCVVSDLLPSIARELGAEPEVHSVDCCKLTGGRCMTREEVFAQVKAILVETLSVDEDKVTEDARFQEDLETDSLDLVELVMTMEEKFGIKISDEEAGEIKTVGDAVDFVMKVAG